MSSREEKIVVAASLFIAIAIGVVAGYFEYAERAIHSYVSDLQHPILDSIFISITSIFDTKIYLGLTVLLLGLLLLYKRRNDFWTGIAVLYGGVIVGWILKQIFSRDRPIGYLVYESDSSFPSGHAIKAALLMFFMMYVFKDEIKNGIQRRLMGSVCWATVVLVCASRIYLGVHWISDVIAGALFSFVWVNWMMLLFFKNK